MTPLPALLGDDEPAPFELINEGGLGNLVLVCDHASNRVPARLANLGLTRLQLASHIGWDSGAAAVSRRLSARLDAPLVLSNYSRLVIDCNRWPAAVDSIPASSDGIVIPGNVALSEEDARAITDRFRAQGFADIRLDTLHHDGARLMGWVLTAQRP